LDLVKMSQTYAEAHVQSTAESLASLAERVERLEIAGGNITERWLGKVVEQEVARQLDSEGRSVGVVRREEVERIARLEAQRLLDTCGGKISGVADSLAAFSRGQEELKQGMSLRLEGLRGEFEAPSDEIGVDSLGCQLETRAHR
jgi:hypothetical protein